MAMTMGKTIGTLNIKVYSLTFATFVLFFIKRTVRSNKPRQVRSRYRIQTTANMDHCDGNSATRADSEQWKRIIAALLCMLGHLIYLYLAIEAQASVTRHHKQRLPANGFTVAAVRRNHFKQALRVLPTTLKYRVDSCRCAGNIKTPI